MLLKGGVAGEIPRTREGRRPGTAVDSGEMPAIHFFVQAALRAMVETVRWLGGKGQAQGLPLRWFVARDGGEGQALFADQTGTNCPRWWSCEGGRCGGNPPAQGRAEGPTAQRRGESGEE